MGKSAVMAILVGSLCFGACVSDADYGSGAGSSSKTGPGLPPPINIDPPNPNFEQIFIDVDVDSTWRFDENYTVSDPCACSSYECLETWTTEHFGCDLCVTLLCEAGDTHVCTACD
jgi:hypothetical protein